MKKIVIFGFGQRGNIYANYALHFPEEFEITAVIENNEDRIKACQGMCKNVPIFNDYKEFILKNISADIVAVATQDHQHKEHAVAMMEAGYDLLLEKPIANNAEDCKAIYEASKAYGRKVVVCHVLRYSPFYSTIKKIIDDGKLGEIVTINASENVGYYHQAHSFVRGPWRNSKMSSPMILAKCCHDMDILRYLMGEKCISLNSYGGLYYFNQDHAPDGATQYCSDCPHSACIYKAQTLYTAQGEGQGQKRWFSNYFTTRELTEENILEDLVHTPYDKCVFQTDNDVVDHQTTIMQFDKGKTACHTMTAFSKEIYRDIKIHGTKAELYGVMENNCLEIRYFGGETERIDINISSYNVGGHNGSDFKMMQSLYRLLNGEQAEGVSYLDISIASHLMSFAAERSRLEQGKTVFINK